MIALSETYPRDCVIHRFCAFLYMSRSIVSAHLVRLNSVAAELATRLAAKSVAHVMFDRGALSTAELDRVTQCPDEPTAAGVLLEIILDEVERATFDCFLDSLRTTNQHELYAWLVYSGFNSSSKEASVMHCDDNFLLLNVDSHLSGLTYELFSAGLIDSRLKSELEAEQNSFHRNQKLVSLIKTSWKTANEVERFLCALDRSGQRQVVDVLRGTSEEESIVADVMPSRVTGSEDSIAYKTTHMCTKYSFFLLCAVAMEITRSTCQSTI